MAPLAMQNDIPRSVKLQAETLRARYSGVSSRGIPVRHNGDAIPARPGVLLGPGVDERHHCVTTARRVRRVG
jgi:hypothetical protein